MANSVARRHFGSSLQLSEKEKNESFKGQLYESTQQRLKRERAEQERFSQFQSQSTSGRIAGIIFCKCLQVFRTPTPNMQFINAGV